MILIDFGLAGSPLVPSDNNESPVHDINELLWHFLFSYGFARSIVMKVREILLPCAIIGPGPLLRRIKGKWGFGDGTSVKGTIADDRPTWTPFCPTVTRMLTRYGHNRPMYPVAAAEFNTRSPEGTFQGLLHERVPRQCRPLTWLPTPETIRKTLA